MEIAAYRAVPGGIALIATFALATDADGVVVNLYDIGTAQLALRGGTPVALATQTQYPASGDIEMTVTTAAKNPFALKLRIPPWCKDPVVLVNGENTSGTTGPDGYLALRRVWRDQDKIQLRLKVEPRVLIGNHMNEGKLAVLYGPLVLAADAAVSPVQTEKAPRFSIPGSDPNQLRITLEAAPDDPKSWPGTTIFRVAELAGPRTYPFAWYRLPTLGQLAPATRFGCHSGRRQKLRIPRGEFTWPLRISPGWFP